MRKLSRWVPVIGGAIAGGIIALVIATSTHSTKTVTSTVVQQATSTTEPTAFSSSGGGMSINQIYKSAAPGVVDIKVRSKSSSALGGGTQEGEGAGVVYDSNGDILTDEHVIDNATDVVVTFQDGTQAKAKVLGSDASTDVGVIKVDVSSSELHPIKFANSDSAQVGDPVVAIGSPFSLPETVTSGIVSQTGRSIMAPNNFTISDAIQTDAAINPGNSGGPLLNADGQVLGLNDQIETDTTNSATGEGQNSGIGFATPANADVKVANEIIAGKTVQHAYLGVCLNGDTAQARIATTPTQSCPSPVASKGPAAVAGLEPGDQILDLNGKSVTTTDDFIAALSAYSPGQTVTLTIKRDGQTKKIQVKLGNRPAEAPTGG